MKCKHCGSPLVARYTQDFPINERGEYTEKSVSRNVGVYCVRCGARHAYNVLWEKDDEIAIALEHESDPDPVASVALVYANEELQAFGSDVLVGLTVIDETRQEVGRFLSSPRDTEWWERWKRVEATIPTKEHRASYRCGSRAITPEGVPHPCVLTVGHEGPHRCDPHKQDTKG